MFLIFHALPDPNLGPTNCPGYLPAEVYRYLWKVMNDLQAGSIIKLLRNVYKTEPNLTLYIPGGMPRGPAMAEKKKSKIHTDLKCFEVVKGVDLMERLMNRGVSHLGL